jgi:hypothetical protein
VALGGQARTKALGALPDGVKGVVAGLAMGRGALAGEQHPRMRLD